MIKKLLKTWAFKLPTILESGYKNVQQKFNTLQSSFDLIYGGEKLFTSITVPEIE